MKRAVFARGMLASSAAVASPAIARAQGQPLVHVASSAVDTFAEAIYAQEGGFFKQAGLNVELVQLPNSGAIAAAVAGGSVDIGLANPIAIANAREQGLPFAIIAPSALYVIEKPTTVLLVPTGSPLRSPKDLEGKTIATAELRGIMEAGIRSWLTRSGADPSSIHFIEMPFATMVAAASQGRVDAAFVAEPVLSTARGTMREIGNPYGALANVWYTNVWFATKDWLTKNTALAHQFVQTMARAAAWANGHQSDTAAILLRYSKLTSDVVASMTRTVYAQDKLDVKRIQPVLDTAAKYGVLKAPMSARELVMSGF